MKGILIGKLFLLANRTEKYIFTTGTQSDKLHLKVTTETNNFTVKETVHYLIYIEQRDTLHRKTQQLYSM